jgi:hypothetical protein
VTTANPGPSTTVAVLNVGSTADVTVAARGHRIQTSRVTLAAGTIIKYRVEAADTTNPNALCARGDYEGAFKLYAADRSQGDAFIVTATCAFAFYDYASAEKLAVRGAAVSGGGGCAHNYFIAQYAAERQGKDGSTYESAGLEAAKQSGQCSGSNSQDECATMYEISVRDGLDNAQTNPR